MDLVIIARFELTMCILLLHHYILQSVFSYIQNERTLRMSKNI